MDAIDQKLLKQYQLHPDWSMTQLGEKVGLSRAACWKRMKALESEGYIEGRAIILSRTKLGLNIAALVQIKLERTIKLTLDEFEAEVHRHPEILECYSMTGNSDYTLKIVVESIEALESFLRETVANFPSVSEISSSIALKTVKNSTALPI